MNFTKQLAIAAIVLTFSASNVSADVTTTGQIVGNPVTSTSSTSLRIGESTQGTMTIDGNGTDHDVYSSAAYLGMNVGSSGVVVVKDNGSKWVNSSTLMVGNGGSGKLDVLNGGSVLSSFGKVGDFGPGTATIDGAGSSWTCSDFLYVGNYGNGTLDIINGGTLSSKGGGISSGPTSNGTVTIDGMGSKWTSIAGKNLYIGNGNSGTLNITDGGKGDVAGSIFNRSNGLIALGFGGNDILAVGGDFTNDGVVRLAADTGLAAGMYTPITVSGAWAGSGEYRTIGGVWDSLAHTFTVSAPQTTTPGTQTSIDLSTHQRLDVGNELTVSFQSGPEILSFIASRSTSTLAGLLGSLGEEESVLSSWDFDITGLTTGNPTMLSYAVTGDPTDVRVWRYDGISWSQYTGGNVFVEDGHATFTVDGFSSYAVTGVGAPVPEPSTLLLLAMGMCGLALMQRCGDKPRH